MPDTPSRPAEGAPPAETATGQARRSGSKPAFFFIGIIVAAVFTIGWGSALMNYGQPEGGVSTQTVGWSPESATEASITFQVSGDEPVSCEIRATDDKHAEVGQARVEVGSDDRDVTAKVETVRRATTVEVVACREQGSTK